MAATSVWLATGNGPQLYAAVSELGLVVGILLVGKLLLDIFAISRAPAVALLAAPLLAFLVGMAQPFLSLGAWIVRQAKGGRMPGGTERVTSDDIQIIVAEGNQERKLEEIEPEEREMIAGIIEMGERSARDIMIPRPDVIAIEVGVQLDEALDIATKHGHSRLPVYEGDIDHVIGILHVKDLIPVLRHPDTSVTLRQLVRPVHYVPDTAKADDLLRELLRDRVHMAVVVDEYGGTVGIVTVEDALEEIVGEIRDEYDQAEEPEFVRLNEDEAVFNGRVPLDEVNEVLDIRLPTEESDTLGGLVYNRLGRMPRTGDQVDVNAVELQVTAMSGRRVKQVHARKLHPVENPEAVTEDASSS
jgi:magnesium and cobalt exporter, CNNM family